MSALRFIIAIMGVVLALASTPFAQSATDDQVDSDPKASLEPQAFLQSLVGSWEGTCRTWFQPGKLADESLVKGEFRLILDGRFLRHTYEGVLQEKAESSGRRKGVVSVYPLLSLEVPVLASQRSQLDHTV